jgi:hypothetical protein
MDELNYIYISYMNDEPISVLVQINHQYFFDPNNPTKPPHIEYVTLLPGEKRLFEIEAPNNATPFVKKWSNKVLLSFE